MLFEERWTRDVGAIFAEASGLGDDVLMELDQDDGAMPVLAPNNAAIRSEQIREDLTRAGLQNGQEVGSLDQLSQLAQMNEKMNTMMLFAILGLGLIAVLLFVSSKRTEKRF